MKAGFCSSLRGEIRAIEVASTLAQMRDGLLEEARGAEAQGDMNGAARLELAAYEIQFAALRIAQSMDSER